MPKNMGTSSKIDKIGTIVKNGRPTVITPEVVNKLVEVLKIGVTIETACSTANISRETFYNRLESDPDFRDKIEWAKNYPRIVAGNVVMSDILKENVDTAKWWLEKKHPEEFGGTKVQVATQINITPPSWWNKED